MTHTHALQKLPRDMSNISLVKSMNIREQVFDKSFQVVAFARKPIDRQIVNRHLVKSCIDGQYVPSRFVEEQTRRSCRVRFEDEATGHVDISVGTAGGKGEEFTTQDNRIGN